MYAAVGALESAAVFMRSYSASMCCCVFIGMSLFWFRIHHHRLPPSGATGLHGQRTCGCSCSRTWHLVVSACSATFCAVVYKDFTFSFEVVDSSLASLVSDFERDFERLHVVVQAAQVDDNALACIGVMLHPSAQDVTDLPSRTISSLRGTLAGRQCLS